jgi:hypothetical protein
MVAYRTKGNAWLLMVTSCLIDSQPILSKSLSLLTIGHPPSNLSA